MEHVHAFILKICTAPSFDQIERGNYPQRTISAVRLIGAMFIIEGDPAAVMLNTEGYELLWESLTWRHHSRIDKAKMQEHAALPRCPSLRRRITISRYERGTVA